MRITVYAPEFVQFILYKHAYDLNHLNMPLSTKTERTCIHHWKATGI